MITQASSRTDRRSTRGAQRSRKVRTADCSKCVIMSSLRAAGVSSPTIQATCESMWLNRAQRKQVLYSEGNGATHLYAIRSGKVKIQKLDVSGRSSVTAILRAGDLFGFEAIFDDTYDSFAEALTDCELCLASADHLHRLIADEPRIATDLARYLHHQLSRTRDHQSVVTATGATAKLAGYLLHSLEWNDEKDDRGPMVAHDLTLGDLGGILGISAETACRVLSRLKTKGIVETHSAGILVRDIDRLRRLARS
jgi:CRP/FNR family transcriptional regulator